jgi:hyperosmotically inducible protein
MLDNLPAGRCLPEEEVMLQRFAMALSAAGLVMTVACSQSDSGIATAVKTKLAADDTVKASEISVDTGKRVVTLNGTVDTPTAKHRAVMIARDTKGVANVIDDIVVDREVAATTGTVEQTPDATGYDIADKTGEVITDAAITSAVKTQFLADPEVSGLKIDVDTNYGVVVLSGNVKSKAEADRASAIARQSRGVHTVINQLHVG